MENWELEKVIKWGRKSIWVAIICLAIPFAEGFFAGLTDSPDDDLSPLSELASIVFLPSVLVGLTAATEASGRTRKGRITTKELKRQFTSEEVNKATNLYYDDPTQFPWHHIMMVPQWGIRLHLKNGWCGVPRHLVLTKINEDTNITDY